MTLGDSWIEVRDGLSHIVEPLVITFGLATVYIQV